MFFPLKLADTHKHTRYNVVKTFKSVERKKTSLISNYFLWRSSVLPGWFSRFSGFLPQTKHMNIGLIGVCVCVRKGRVTRDPPPWPTITRALIKRGWLEAQIKHFWCYFRSPPPSWTPSGSRRLMTPSDVSSQFIVLKSAASSRPLPSPSAGSVWRQQWRCCWTPRGHCRDLIQGCWNFTDVCLFW